MGTGKLHAVELEHALSQVKSLRGDYAEIGVYRGDLFNRLALRAAQEGRIAHAFDSFRGMAPPGPHDDPGKYPAGVLSVGSPEKFRALLSAPASSYRLWPGWIPDCFASAGQLELAFAWVDVDHHDPTEHAIAWAWPRMVTGGILGFDDYFPGRVHLATPPIERFLHDRLGIDIDSLRVNDNNQLFVRKR